MEFKESKKIERREFLKCVGVLGVGAMASPFLTACSSSSNTGDPKNSTSTPAKKPMTIKYACSFTEDQMDLKELGTWKFKELVEKYSNGEVIVNIYPGEQLGAQRDVMQKCQAGAIEFTHTSSGNLSQFIPPLNLLDLPYLFPDPIKFKEFMEGPKFMEIFGASYAAKEFGQGWWAIDGPRVLGLNKKIKKVVKTPADIKGMKIRVTGSAMEQAAFNLAGASPVPVAWGECYTGMQQGVFDGLNVGIPALHVNGYFEVMTNVTETNFMYNSDLTIYSLKWWNTLDQDHKDLFTKVINECATYTSGRKRQSEDKIKKIWTEEKGINIYTPTPAELEQWITTIGYQKPEYDEFSTQFGKDIADKLKAVAKELS